MFCSKCGKDNPDDARFCGTCGAPMHVAPQAAAAPSAPPPVHVYQPGPPPGPPPGASVADARPAPVSAGMTWGIAAATLIIPLIGLVMGIIYLKDANPAKKSAGKLWLIVGIVMFLVWWAAAYSDM